jgi:hypothetical protein
MSIKYRGFVFEQINVFGRDIPCKSCIEEVWGELSKSSQIELHTYSNEVVSKLKEDFNMPLISDCYTQLDRAGLVYGCFQVDIELCELTGLYFPTVIQAQFICLWFISLLGNFPGNRMQKVRKLMPTNIAFHNGYEISQSRAKYFTEEIDPLPDYSRLEKHYEYLVATRTLEWFYYFCEINPRTSDWVSRKLQIILALATISEGETGSIIVFCPFCRCLSIEAQSTRQNVHCESAKCKATYSTSFNTSKYKRTDWVKDPNVSPKLCVGECESRQKWLNNQRYCRRCWDKLHVP